MMRSGKTLRPGDRVHSKSHTCNMIVVQEPSGGMVACKLVCNGTVVWCKLSEMEIGWKDAHEGCGNN